MMERTPGVLLMTYGSPRSLQRRDVADYLARVRGGREPDAELVEEFSRRYRTIGGSPLIEITERQARGVEARLGWPVAAGMRFSDPSIEAGARALIDRGVDHIVVIVMSPQFSPLLMGGYGRALDEARAAIGPQAPAVTLAGPWHEESAFVEAVADRVRRQIVRFPSDERSRVPVLLTAHSLPRRVADEEPGYIEQLQSTASAVAAQAGLADERWHFCWQSAGHEPGEWMKPDFADLMPKIAAEGHSGVVVAPVQFLADHLEVLYDVDVGAREQAERAGLRFSRIESLNVHPTFIAALASVARRTAAAA
jgi:ferrochelatase